MAAFQTLGVPDSKDVPDVLAPLPVVQGGLARIGFGAHHACRIGRDAGGFGYAPRYPIALVVAPLTFLFPRQGNGYDEVYPVEKACGFQFLGHHAPHGFPYFGMVMVFQLEQNAAVRRVWGVMEKRNSFFDGNQSPKYAGDVVFFKRDGPDTWEVGLHRTQSTSSPGDMRLRQQRQYRGKKKSKRAWRYSERLCKILFFHMQATRNGIHFKSAAEAEANEFPVALIVGSSLHAPGFALQKLTEDT